jgi:sulfur carrier protein ThiS
VRIAVDCKTAYARDPQAVASLSQAGVILAEKEVTLPAGATVKDALAATGLRVDASGGYVFGIAGLSEGDIGAASGWMYSVNGSYPSVAYTVYQLKAADRIVWRYTCNQGEDVGAGGF